MEQGDWLGRGWPHPRTTNRRDRWRERRGARLLAVSYGAGLIGSLFLLPGCFRRYTVTKFNDPTLVEVRLQEPTDAEAATLPARIPSATVDTVAGPVQLTRESGGAIRVTRGEDAEELLDSNGELRTEEPPTVGTPEFRAEEEVRFVVGASSYNTLDVLVLEPAVTTPWTNVAEITKVRDPKHSVGGLLFLGTIFLFVGGVLVAVGEELTGGLLAVGGLATDGVGVYFLAAPPKRTTLYPSSTP